jgi:very-short-patch-repair endonuclease
MGYEQLVDELGLACHGVITRAQLQERGLTGADVAWLVRSGRLHRLYPGVYRVSGSPPTWKTGLLAASRAGGSSAAASHRSAAALWDLPGGREDLAEITCPRWRRARHAGLVIHETNLLGATDRTRTDGIPVTTPARTLADLGATCSSLMVEMAVDNALRRGLVTYPLLFRLLDRIGKQGRNGVGVLRAILRERDLKHRPTESQKETELLRVIRRSGLPVPQPQFEISGTSGFIARVDFAYPSVRLVVEYDSKAHHVGGVEMEHDNARRNRLVAVGWTVLVATQRDLRDGGAELCRAIRAHFDRFGVTRSRQSATK